MSKCTLVESHVASKRLPGSRASIAALETSECPGSWTLGFSRVRVEHPPRRVGCGYGCVVARGPAAVYHPKAGALLLLWAWVVHQAAVTQWVSVPPRGLGGSQYVTPEGVQPFWGP